MWEISNQSGLNRGLYWKNLPKCEDGGVFLHTAESVVVCFLCPILPKRGISRLVMAASRHFLLICLKKPLILCHFCDNAADKIDCCTFSRFPVGERNMQASGEKKLDPRSVAKWGAGFRKCGKFKVPANVRDIRLGNLTLRPSLSAFIERRKRGEREKILQRTV